ncbi:MAG TPA: hypothetical protein VLB84_08510 [Bacteroidia bacterium]|nr:hypothetical protein [Bacteroidia bacterium]
MNVDNNRCLLFFALVILIQVSCIESKKIVSPVAVQTEQEEEGKLLFINLLFSKTSDGKDSCNIINSIVVEGTLKEEAVHPVRNKENYYTLFLNSCDGKTLYKEELDNQLDTQMEVYKEGGTIALKTVNFKQREYSIRMQKGKEKICRLIVIKTEKGQTETICNHLITL